MATPSAPSARSASSPARDFHARLSLELQRAKESFARRNPRSHAHFRDEATQRMPGGSTRNTISHPPFPLFIQRGVGNRLCDLDGKEYIDVFGDATAGIYGHSHPVVKRALNEAFETGMNMGAHNLMEAKFAKEVCERFDLELVRFANSGTEANLMAIQTARLATKRSKVFVFDGCYHGAVFIFRDGPHPISAPFDYVVGTYNDVEGTRALLREHGADTACVILEVMIGGGGCIPASREFVRMLREETRRLGVCLIFDEVMTNRLTPSGISPLYSVQPDLKTLGKSVAGGTSFGAWGGSRTFMGIFDSRLPTSMPHAGTYNNNTIMMTAGYRALTEAFTPEMCKRLNAVGDGLRDRLNAVAEAMSAPVMFTGIGSMIGTHFTIRKRLETPADLRDSSPLLREVLFFDLNEAGIWASKGGTMNLSLPFVEAPGDIDKVVKVFGEWLERRKGLWEGYKRSVSEVGGGSGGGKL